MGVGDAYDNAMAESFVSTQKRGLVHRGVWPTWEAARLTISEYIEVFYNRSRLDLATGYLSLAQFEQGCAMTDAAAA